MKSSIASALVLAATTWLLPINTAQSAQVADVLRKLQAGEPIAFIDIRSTEFYQKGRIEGAINIPAAVVADKRLPRLGTVIVYDDGLGGKSSEAVVAALNQKPGIKAELLDGGYAAWIAAKGPATIPFGMTKEEIPQITYQKLKTTSPDDVVLVDLRKPASAPAGQSLKSGEPVALTDLRSEFPGAPVVRSPFQAGIATRSAAGGGTPLYVLVDNGDGTAEQTARAMKANGMTRYVILAGGEAALARKGQAGLQRQGHTVEAPPGVEIPAIKP